MLPPDAVVLLTGGARGITAQVARELARHRPTLVLVGRSTLSDEAPEVAGCADARSLTSALTESALRAGDVPDLPTINRRVRDLLAAREVRGNLAALRATGAQVEYRSADLRDEQQVAALLRSVHQRYGRLDGVVHGAGVLEDRLVQDKEPASFDRVFDTKVDSAFALVRHLDPSGLRFLVFFTSVAGRFGNAGQTDYAAANEVLASLARDLNDRWPTRVVAMCWGPWAGGGMVTPEVQRRFLERGVEPLTPELGRRLFVDELERGSAGDAVVILGRGPWARRPSSGAGTTNPTPLPTPLPMRLRATADDDGRAVVDVVLDPHTDHYLRDHRLDGNPVLPAAVAAELCAEAVELVRPGELAAAVEDLALLHGVILTGDVPTRLVLTVAPDLQGRGDDRTWVVTLDQEDGPGAYRCGVVLADALPERVGPVVTTLAGRGAPTPPPKAAMYTEMLFHGPLLQGIDSVEAAGPLWQAAVHGVHPERFTARSPGGRWVLDPSLLDLAPQLAILWARATYGTTTLPVRWASVRRGPASGPDEGLSAVFRVREGADPSWLTADLDVLNADGSVRLSVEGLETVGTAALNRLASAGATS